VVAWAKKAPQDVAFRRVPAVPSAAWEESARMFYTLEAMGKLDEYHPKVFDAIHKSNVNLNNRKMRDEWLAKNGIDPAKYAEASAWIVPGRSGKRSLWRASRAAAGPSRRRRITRSSTAWEQPTRVSSCWTYREQARTAARRRAPSPTATPSAPA
jgi:hypothetical protein